MRDEPDNVIPFPGRVDLGIKDKLDAAIATVMDDAERFSRELKLLLEKHGFAASYIESVVGDLTEAYLNEDAEPIWLWPNYRPPGTGDV